MRMPVCGRVASWDFQALFPLCPERKYQLMTSKKEMPDSQTVFLQREDERSVSKYLRKVESHAEK